MRTYLQDNVPGFRRVERLPSQLLRRSPFAGSIRPTRIPLVAIGSGRPSQPFPHPWNYSTPLRILEAFFWNADAESGSGRHNRFLDVPGFAPVLVTRDPQLIRAISASTGEKDGQFDRDTMPSTGIARATGADTLLYANGPLWKRQKQLSAPPFSRATLFQPERFHDFEESFRHTVRRRVQRFRERIERDGEARRVRLDLEIKAVMLEMLVNNFFGGAVDYDEIRNRYVPAVDRVISHIVRDTVVNKARVPLRSLPSVSRGIADFKAARADFERLTDIVLEARRGRRGLWSQFKSDAPDESLRSNIRVFLAGALEATTSYASWTISHLARNRAAQQRVFHEIKDIDAYTPDALRTAAYFGHALNETLRLTPALYFHPRRARARTLVETQTGETLWIPKGAHILLDVWHANRHEDHWGVGVSGFPADQFKPERWEAMEAQGKSANDMLHFGFGHGPRFCPGKNLGQLEVALVVGAFVKLFDFKAVNAACQAQAGVSTKPMDGVLMDLSLRDTHAYAERPFDAERGAAPVKCPFVNPPKPNAPSE